MSDADSSALTGSKNPAEIHQPITYTLPEELIAQTPLEDRSASRLLVLHKDSGEIEHRTFRDIVHYLNPGDLLVMNNTVVTARKLLGQRIRQDGTLAPPQEFLLMGVTEERVRGVQPHFEFMSRSAKRFKPGSLVRFETGEAGTAPGHAEFIGRIGEKSPRGFLMIEFSPSADLPRQLESASMAALPPYIHQNLSERNRYQTVYAQAILGQGSAAAPTAGLHFTDDLLAQLAQKGVQEAFVNLSVGLDTFRPIQAERLEDHIMAGEECAISAEVANTISATTGRIIAVGTTSCRTLETFARLESSSRHHLASGSVVSKLFLYPGKPFHVVDGLLTNFHMPNTSMLLMIAAMAGRKPIERAYAEAVERRYRFLSFGDAMLII